MVDIVDELLKAHLYGRDDEDTRDARKFIFTRSPPADYVPKDTDAWLDWHEYERSIPPVTHGKSLGEILEEAAAEIMRLRAEIESAKSYED